MAVALLDCNFRFPEVGIGWLCNRYFNIVSL